MPCYSVIIFDLDGTLLDTVDDIGSAANQVLKEMGYSSHPLSAYRQFVGSGVAVLFERALPKADVHPRVVAKCIARFERAYEACWNQATTPYQKIPQLLDELLELGYHLAVLSNKPDLHLQKNACLEYFAPSINLIPVFGQRIGVARKPDPYAVREIMKYHGVSAKQTLFVGDSEIDIQTAQNAGIFSVGVAWGYRSAESLVAQGVDLLIDHPSDLLSFLREHS